MICLILTLLELLYSKLMRIISFFFFQAEDGIRDYKVTGVQTCALPISLPTGAWFLRRKAVRSARPSRAACVNSLSVRRRQRLWSGICAAARATDDLRRHERIGSSLHPGAEERGGHSLARVLGRAAGDQRVVAGRVCFRRRNQGAYRPGSSEPGEARHGASPRIRGQALHGSRSRTRGIPPRGRAGRRRRVEAESRSEERRVGK